MGLIVAILVLMAGCVFVVVNLVRPPIDAANSFVALLDDGEIEAAYDSLCDSTRENLTLEQFREDVALSDQITGYTLTAASTGTGQLTLVTSTIEVNDEARNISFRLAREDSTWQVCNYDLIQ